VISLTHFFDSASRRHNDVILLPAIRRVSGNDFVPAGQCTGTLRCARATVELMRQETPNFLASNLWPLNCPDLSPVDYEIWAFMQHRVYTTDKSKVWMNWNAGSGAVLNSRFLTRLLTSGEEDIGVHAKGVHFEYSLWTDNVDFVHNCYIQCDLFDCYIFNYEIMPATLANTFLFILRGRALADLRYSGRFYGMLCRS